MKGTRRPKHLSSRVCAFVLVLVTIFLSVFTGTDIKVKAQSATITQGENLYYSWYGLGTHSTHRYSWGDRVIYCIESNKSAPGSGAVYPESYIADNGSTTSFNRSLLACAIAHGPGGEIYYAGKLWWRDHGYSNIADDDNAMYVVTHIAANYAYSGISSDATIYYGVANEMIPVFDQYMQFLGAVADGEATYPHEGQPNTRWENFWVEILMPGSDTNLQQMAAYAGANRKGSGPSSLEITVAVTKNGESLPVEGAVYGFYKSDGTELSRVTLSGNSPAKGTITLNITESGEYYVQEITPPTGYFLDEKKYPITVNVSGQSISSSDRSIVIDGRTANITVPETEIDLTPSIQITKAGGRDSVRGAVYTMYRYDSATLSENPVVATATIDTPVGGVETTMSGTFNKTFKASEAGKWYYIKETKGPSNGMYKLDTSTYWFELVLEGSSLVLKPYDNQAAALINGSTIQVKANQISIKSNETNLASVLLRVKKNGDSDDERANLDGAVYSLYQCDSVETADTTKKKVQDIILKVSGSDKKHATGSISNKLEPGTYFVLETKSPHGYKRDKNKYFFTVTNKGEISTKDPIFSVDGQTLEATVDDEEDTKPFTGKIVVKKNGECNLPGDGGDVSKAVYGLFKNDGSENGVLLQEITLSGSRTNATGEFNYKFTELGEYFVKEISSPEYFELDEHRYTFHVTLVDKELISDDNDLIVSTLDPEEATVEVYETPNAYQWDLKIHKKADSSGDYTSLTGVVYGLFKENGKEVARCELTGDNTGATGEFPTMIFQKGDGGSYYVQEIETVKGFRLNEKKYPFSVNIKSQKIVTTEADIDISDNLATVNAVDTAEEGKFTFVKRGEDGLLIKGAKFEVYLKSALTKDPESGAYDFTGAKVYQTLTSGDNGVVTSESLHLGTYVIREIFVSEQYQLMAPFEVTISKDLEVVDLGEKTDGNVPMYIRATKKDTGRDTVVLKAGTTYTIEAADGTLIADKSGNTKFVCDETGVILIDAPLKPGDYIITEIRQPDEYLLDSKAVKITVNADLSYVVENELHIHDVEFYNTEKKGEITVKKTGNTLTSYQDESFIWEEAPIPGAIFEVRVRETIYSKDNQGTVVYEKDAVVGTIETGKDGTATITDLPLGKYYLVETTAPVGYILNQTPVEVELKDGKPSVEKIVETKTVFDEKQSVVLDLYKFDEETKKPLAGAKYGLYAEEDIKNFKGNVIVKKGDFLAYATSDAKGKIVFTIDLPFSTYRIREELAPKNYVRNEKEYTFTAKEPKSTVATVTYTSEWGNKPVKGDVHFVKKGESLTDFKDGKFVYEEKSLSGAVFDVYAKEVFTYDGAVDENGERTRYYKEGELIKTIKTDENGKASITGMPIGTYYLVETKAPYGMARMDAPYEFEIKYVDQNTPIVLSVETVMNTRQKVIMTIKKLQRGSGRGLNGGTFALYAEEDIKNFNGDVIVKKDDKIAQAGAKDGLVDFGLDLPHAKYYVKEIGAVSGHYSISETFPLDVSYTTDELKELGIECTIYNDKIPILGRVIFKLGNKVFEKNENNYITGDTEGNAGYSVLIGEAGDIKKARSIAPVYIYALLGAVAFILAGVAFTIIYRKKRGIAGMSEDIADELLVIEKEGVKGDRYEE